MKTITKLLILTIPLLFQNCATLTSGSRTCVSVKSKGPAAKVYYNGNYQCTTPCSVQVPKSDLGPNAKIELRAEGYEPQVVPISRKVKAGALVCDVLCGVIVSCGIDFITGYIYKGSPDNITYNPPPVVTGPTQNSPVVSTTITPVKTPPPATISVSNTKPDSPIQPLNTPTVNPNPLGYQIGDAVKFATGSRITTGIIKDIAGDTALIEHKAALGNKITTLKKLSDLIK